MGDVIDRQVLLLLSGGLDSACCLSFLKTNDKSVECTFIDYGQPAALAEAKSAANIAEYYDSDLRSLRISLDRNVTAGELTGRNATLVFVALLSAQTLPTSICLGIHAGTNYYDCSRAFHADLDRLVAEISGGRTRVLAPFISWTKSDIVRFASENAVPTQLTYSCEAANTPCHECLSCTDRRLIECL